MGTVFLCAIAIFTLYCLVILVHGLWNMAEEWGVGFNEKTAVWFLENGHLVVYWIMGVVGSTLWLFGQRVEVAYWGSPVGYDFGAPMPYYHVVPNFWYSAGVWCLYLVIPATILTWVLCLAITHWHPCKRPQTAS